MRALVPSGGRGIRLRPITHTNAKQLIPVAGEPVLFRVLRHIAAAGISECGIVIGETGEEIREACGDGERFGLRLTYIPQDEPRGLADCVKVSRDFLGDEPFLMYLGDNMLAEGVADLVSAFEQTPVAAQILTVRVPRPQRFGVVTLAQDGSVASVEEKPSHPTSDLALAGVYIFDQRIHTVIDDLAPSARGELEITDAIQSLLESGQPVRAFEAKGWWKDTGLPEDLLEANRLVLAGMQDQRIEGDVRECEIEGPVVVGAGAMVSGGKLIGPCVIGPGSMVTSSIIGPDAAIGAGCNLEDVTIENSIIMDESVVHGSHLHGSVLGRAVEVRGKGSARLTVGDHGSVTLG